MRAVQQLIGLIIIDKSFIGGVPVEFSLGFHGNRMNNTGRT